MQNKLIFFNRLELNLFDILTKKGELVLSGFKQNKHYTLHKITNVFYLIIIIPFLIIGFISAMSMYSTKMAGGLPNLFGYYAVAMQNNSWYWDESVNPAHPNNAQMTALYGKYKKGNVILFKAVNVNDLKEGDRVIYYYNPGSNEIGGSYPEWEPLNATYSSSQNNVATVIMAELAGKKATITDENGKEYTCFSYYKSYVKIGETTTEELLIADNIIGVEVQDNNFLKDLILFVSSFNGFLTLVMLPIIVLIILKIISLACYKKYISNVDYSQKAQILGAGQNVSYAKVVQGVRQAKTAETQRGAGAPMPPPLRQNMQNLNAKPAPMQRTQINQAAQKTRAQTTQNSRLQTPISRTQVSTPQAQRQPLPTTRTQNSQSSTNLKSTRVAKQESTRKAQKQQPEKIVSTRLANKNKK